MRPSLNHDWAVWAVTKMTANNEEPAGCISDILHLGSEEECRFYVEVAETAFALIDVDIAERCRLSSTKCRVKVH